MLQQIRAKYLLIALVLLDIVFIQLHRLFGQQVLGIEFSLEEENGFGEYYQHIKELAAAIIAYICFRKTGAPLYIFWTLLFVYLFLDDTFMFHEKVGEALATSFDRMIIHGLRPQDYGELLLVGIVGLFFAGLLAVTYRLSSKMARAESKTFLLILIIYGFFAVLIDMMHVMIAAAPWHQRFATLEEGGELLIMSIMLWYITAIWQKINHDFKPR